MANVLDGLGLEGSILDGLDDWPRSATRKELYRCLGHLVGKGGPPRNEEKNQVDDFHRLVIPIAGIAMPGTSGLTAPAV